MANPSVAMIGSFHRALDQMQEAISVFTTNGIEVVNPLSTEPFEPAVDFVRFATDEAHLTDAEVQTRALERILGATAVFVICPNGYVGKTTSYEWGFIEGRKRPAYFSEEPETWFMKPHSKDRIITPEKLSELILCNNVVPIHDHLEF